MLCVSVAAKMLHPSSKVEILDMVLSLKKTQPTDLLQAVISLGSYAGHHHPPLHAVQPDRCPLRFLIHGGARTLWPRKQ